MFVDSHAHITSQEFDDDIEDVLLRAKEGGVSVIVTANSSLALLKKSIDYSKKFSFIQIVTVAGVPPHDISLYSEKEPLFFEKDKKKLFGIGEIGLDYYYDKDSESRKKQKELFVKQLALARELNLPIVVHCRDAFEDLFFLLGTYYSKPSGGWFPGMLHCFTGSKKDMQTLVEKGWYISFSGIITFKKSLELQILAKEIPLNNLLVETDSPFLAPEPFRGRRNEPEFIFNTVKKLACIRNEPEDKLVTEVFNNAKNLFGF